MMTTETIRELRTEKLGMNQREFARLLRISHEHMNRIERGKLAPSGSMELLVKILSASEEARAIAKQESVNDASL